jgi:tRNA U34 5-carboxymethylaminomethyl modifying GTPase MnmE/TrmE
MQVLIELLGEVTCPIIRQQHCPILHGHVLRGARQAGVSDLVEPVAQAEAVLDIIRAKTDSALKVGMEQLKGHLSQEINKIREILLDILSALEASIDFPEEEIDAKHLKDISKKLRTNKYQN